MMPTVADDAPRVFARTISARISALNAKFEPATSSTPARMNGWPHNQRTPSSISARSFVTERGRSSWNFVRMKNSDTNEAA